MGSASCKQTSQEREYEIPHVDLIFGGNFGKQKMIGGMCLGVGRKQEGQSQLWEF